MVSSFISGTYTMLKMGWLIVSLRGVWCKIGTSKGNKHIAYQYKLLRHDFLVPCRDRSLRSLEEVPHRLCCLVVFVTTATPCTF